jgi:excisionase family DNA binding protein
VINYRNKPMVDDTLHPAPGYLTALQAARDLSVSVDAIYEYIARNELPAARVGNTWLIPREAVELRLARGSGGGRRFTPAHAWGLLYLSAEMEPSWLDRHARWRLRRYLQTHSLHDLRAKLVNRGRPRAYRVHPGMLARLHDDPSLMLTGTSGASELRLGLIGGGDRVDAYVDADLLEAVVRRHHLRPSREANVTLRVVASFGWAWPPARVAPIPAIALDLLDDPEPRAKQVGDKLLSGISA